MVGPSPPSDAPSSPSYAVSAPLLVSEEEPVALCNDAAGLVGVGVGGGSGGGRRQLAVLAVVALRRGQTPRLSRAAPTRRQSPSHHSHLLRHGGGAAYVSYWQGCVLYMYRLLSIASQVSLARRLRGVVFVSAWRSHAHVPLIHAAVINWCALDTTVQSILNMFVKHMHRVLPDARRVVARSGNHLRTGGGTCVRTVSHAARCRRSYETHKYVKEKKKSIQGSVKKSQALARLEDLARVSNFHCVHHP